MNGVTFKKITPTNPELVVIVCSGKSVKQFNLKNLPDSAVIIAVNGAAEFLPRLDYWFTSDPWGLHGPQLPINKRCEMWAAVGDDFATRYARVDTHKKTPHRDINFLHRLISHNNPNTTSETAYSLGLSEDPRCISGGNSGYGALNFAYHLKPKNIIILGMDGDIGYFYSDSKRNRALTFLPQMIDSTKEQFEKSGIKVINASPNSKITTFERMSPEDAFKNILGDSYKTSHTVDKIPSLTNKPIVACVLKRSKVYTPEYVNKLFRMVKNNTTIDLDFVCFTDSDDGLDKEIIIQPFRNDFSGWWNKIEMFNPEVYRDRNIFFMDLDTIIVDNIDHIIGREYKFAGIRDFYHKHRFASGLMAWKQTGKHKIYERFVLSSANIIRSTTMGDQEYIGKCVDTDATYLQDIFPNEIFSYKADCIKHGKETIPSTAKIICFHGVPKPHELKINSLLYKYWNLDGND